MHSHTNILERGQPIDKASKALIMLHGRGSSASNILGLADRLDAEDFYIVAPQATNSSWYPYSFMAEDSTNEPWLTSAVETIKKLIDETSLRIPKSQIYVLGFSQGACLALEISSRYAEKYGGIVAFSGGLIGKSLNETKYKGNFQGTKVFIGNSDIDPHIPLERSKQSKDVMEKLGASATLKVYEGMAHTVNQDEINWVNSNLLRTQ
ncbi:MAG: dienelactone hydrolase family protein [Chlamydiales bacterium]|nr:dienelactone hydrolase family protein [Chlamydiales bacterium]